MELLYGTTNEGKILAMKRTLKPLGISLKGLKDLECEIPHVKETGNSPLENARQKARAYYQAFHIPVFSCDTGLYFENIPEEFQPGIYVRRPLGYEMSDEQMTEYYRGLAVRFCDLRSQYRNAICYYRSEQEVYESDSPKLSGEAFLLTAIPHPKSQPGFPLDRISIQISSGAYYYDLPQNAQDEVALDEGFQEFFRNCMVC